MSQRHFTTARARRVARRRREGMSLVEIMIVVIIMAMIATAVGVALLPQLDKAKVDSTRTDAKAISSAATMWIAERGGCPSVQDLIDDRILDGKKRTRDAWDREFVIECDQDGPLIISAGKDGQIGTEDDIQG